MKTFRRLLAVVFWSAMMASCFSPPEYPNTPEIVFKDVQFKKGGTLPDGSFVADTIFLTLSFKDGDGDIGLSSDDIAPPFNDRWYFTKAKLQRNDKIFDDCTSYNNRCWYFPGNVGTEFDKFVDYSDTRKPQYDTLKNSKPFAKPFNCFNWQVVYYDHDNNNQTVNIPYDTLFFVLNNHYNNIFVDIEERTDGNPPYKTFSERENFTYPACGVRIFNGRIPVLQDETGGKGTPLEGDIRFAIPSISYFAIFGSKFLRLKVYIEDRALHQSNVIYTKEFQVVQ